MSTELIELGRHWLEHAPDVGMRLGDLAGWTGNVGFVCQRCASRIMGRGCNLRMLADTPVWGQTALKCDLCEAKP